MFTLAEALGEGATVSRSTVSRICTEIQEQMAAWQQRRLDELELDYLFLDASFFRYHVGAAAEPVLAAWGITTDGKPVFVGLDTSAAESTDAWSGFLSDLGARGLRCPLLVVSDGAAGLIAAVEQTMGAALRQRCLIHRARNLLSKIPKNAQVEVKADYWKIFEVPETRAPSRYGRRACATRCCPGVPQSYVFHRGCHWRARTPLAGHRKLQRAPLVCGWSMPSCTLARSQSRYCCVADDRVSVRPPRLMTKHDAPGPRPHQPLPIWVPEKALQCVKARSCSPWPV